MWLNISGTIMTIIFATTIFYDDITKRKDVKAFDIFMTLSFLVFIIASIWNNR